MYQNDASGYREPECGDGDGLDPERYLPVLLKILYVRAKAGMGHEPLVQTGRALEPAPGREQQERSRRNDREEHPQDSESQ